MSTSSLVIDSNQTGIAYTADLNNALAAINSAHSGITAPTEDIVSGKLWLDTSGSNPVLKIYNNGWKALFTVNPAVDPDITMVRNINVSNKVEVVKDIKAGFGSGGVSININDGGGNANVTFNHFSKVPEQDGNAGRIHVNTDSTTNAEMVFQVVSGGLAGVSINPVNAAKFTPLQQELNYNASKKFETTSSGATVTGDLTATGNIQAVDVNVTSDKRLKNHINPISNSLDTVCKLEGKSYTINDKTSFGVIAQEIEKVIPEVVSEKSDGYKSVNYNAIVPFLIEAIKDQQKQINDLKFELEKLK